MGQRELLSCGITLTFMGHWIDAVRGKVPFDDDVVTVGVSPTEEFASLLEKRLDFLDSQILPELDQAIGSL